MRGFTRRIAEGQSHGALANPRRQRRDTRGPRLVLQQTLDPRPHEPLLPAPHRNFACAGLAHDLIGAQAIHRQQHDPRPPDVLLPAVSIATIASKRARSAALTSTVIPSRMPTPFRQLDHTRDQDSSVWFIPLVACGLTD